MTADDFNLRHFAGNLGNEETAPIPQSVILSLEVTIYWQTTGVRWRAGGCAAIGRRS
jgi:hypothetical protein